MKEIIKNQISSVIFKKISELEDEEIAYLEDKVKELEKEQEEMI